MESKQVVEQDKEGIRLQKIAYRICFVFILNPWSMLYFIDRQNNWYLRPSIKADLGLDDTQLGWLKVYILRYYIQY